MHKLEQIQNEWSENVDQYILIYTKTFSSTELRGLEK